MELIYYSHIFGILFISLFFIMIFNGIWWWYVWLFLILAPFSYTPVIYYRRRRKTTDDETLSLVEQRQVKAFYDNVIKF